ncbi:syntaxin-7 [Cimex lectularius]|uniref:t-SNARE coiled-coil homology domain-containing protein n=1 Tax=Cimex lectularius TaxID=79782 RepID=A0A8I6RFN6_CIMLE|nr:syntaxin-7 [Cimex lectularius]
MEGGFNSYQNGSDRRDFNQTAQKIGTNIQKILQNVVSMKKMVNVLGTFQETPELRLKLHQIQHYTNNLATDTSDSLKTLSNIPFPQSTENKEYKMQKERLVEEFMSALNAFQESQRLALEKEKKDIAQKNVTSLLPPPNSTHGTSHGDQLIELTPSVKTQAQLQQEERDIRLLEQQRAEMLQLEDDISKVNNIFKELGNMVHNQGEFVDSIEANVESASVFVSEGATQLREAHRLKSKLRKYKCILLLIPLTFLICLIIFLSWNSN